MPRPLRLHQPGGFYHVTLRGNHRQDIFRTSKDRELLDEIVASAVRDLGVRVHAYCWMTNHIHLLAQVSDTPLGKFILRIASRYARRFQQRLQTTGHLFQRRYHAILVDADSYLLALIRYIHLNPVRAGLVNDPRAFPWSSHGEYVGRRRVPWVHTNFALGMLSADPSVAVSRYLDWMNAADGTRWGEGMLVANPENSQVLGDEAFLARLAGHESPMHARSTIEELLVECGQLFSVTPDALASNSRSRHLVPARAWLAHQVIARGVDSTSSLARRLGRSEAAIRGLMARHPVRLENKFDKCDPAP
jgi:putative transposase